MPIAAAIGLNAIRFTTIAGFIRIPELVATAEAMGFVKPVAVLAMVKLDSILAASEFWERARWSSSWFCAADVEL